jgi:protein-S-isoprenylcysteine O-methyltransferase Ste14
MPESAPSKAGDETREGKKAGEEAPPPGGLFFRYRNALGVVIAVFLVAFPFWRAPLKPWHLAVGLLLVFSGIALRLWCILQIGGSARKTSRLKAVRIISWGPYAILRNPIYVANTTVFAGFTVLSGHLWAIPLVILSFWAWYDGIVRREEKFLEESFPEDYRAYAAATRRWIPSMRLSHRPPEVPPYPFLRALKRERGHLITVSAGLLMVICCRLFFHI